MPLLALGFFIISFFYSMVGFGGGSSYIAILALSEMDYQLIPKIALICNIIVVCSSSFFFYRRSLIEKKIFLPIVLSSAPMAFFGGLYPLSAKLFYYLLTLSLFLIALKILFFSPKVNKNLVPLKIVHAIIIGALIGLLSGLVGIGGGIFLSPILIAFRWARAKQAAAISCYFILINSFFGLIGQLIKGDILFNTIIEFSPLLLAVLIGGQLGIRIGAHENTSSYFVKKMTGVLILLISLNIFRNII